VRSKILTAVSTKMAVFGDVTPCSMVEVCGRFGATFCLSSGSKSKPCKQARTKRIEINCNAFIIQRKIVHIDCPTMRLHSTGYFFHDYQRPDLSSDIEINISAFTVFLLSRFLTFSSPFPLFFLLYFVFYILSTFYFLS
jgi:hypothetical protein